jgi:hypothetical protein
MRPTIWLTVILLIGLASGAWPSQLKADEQTDTRRTALQPVSFRPLALGQVKPAGWLRKQIETQAAGLSSAAVEPGEKRNPTRGVDPDPLRMHRPADHRVPDAGTALTIEDERSFPVRAGRAYHVSGPRAS